MSERPDRDAVTSELSPELIEDLEDTARTLGLPPSAWWSLPGCRGYAVLRAAAKRYERYVGAGRSEPEARSTAGTMVGRSGSFLRVTIERVEDSLTATAA